MQKNFSYVFHKLVTSSEKERGEETASKEIVSKAVIKNHKLRLYALMGEHKKMQS
mgnify:FL=1